MDGTTFRVVTKRAGENDQQGNKDLGTWIKLVWTFEIIFNLSQLFSEKFKKKKKRYL